MFTVSSHRIIVAPPTHGRASVDTNRRRLPERRSLPSLLLVALLALMLVGASAAPAQASGTAWAWGNNETGQLGDGTTVERHSPVEVSALSGVTAVAGGSTHTLALQSDGTVWSWGFNEMGQLGDGTTTERHVPAQVAGLSGVVAIDAAHWHSLALKSDGTVWAWGYNAYGQLGDGTRTSRLTPGQVTGLTGVIAIAGGTLHNLALKSDGTAWAWGGNTQGQLGDGTTTDRLIPVQVSGLTGVTAIGGGYLHSAALKGDGTVWAWGWNTYGQVGDGTTLDRHTPVPVSNLNGVTAIGADVFSYHTTALKSDGTVWAWGYNENGQLGDGTTVNRAVPVQVRGLTGVTAVSCGYRHSLALKSDGTAWAWGGNIQGQLGDGSTTDRLAPVQVSGLTGVIAISGGSFHSLAITGAADTVAPTLTYTNPAPGAAQRTLAAIVGTAADEAGGSGLASVTVSLRRRSDNRYWSGAAWVTAPVELEVAGTESWYVTSALPAGANLPEGGYLLLGSVTDNAGNTRSVNASFSIDRTAPISVRVVKPSEGSWVNALTSITGTSADNSGGSGIAKVTLRLRRESDGKYWRGSSWGGVVGLGVVGTTSWSKSAGLPSGGHLLEGAYTLFAFAFDRAGNIKSATSTFSVDRTAPTTLTFTTPTNGSTISSLPAIAGTAADYSGGSGVRLVTVRLRRLNDPAISTDDRYWNGSAWTSSVATLATDNQPSWSVTSALPSGSSLPPGAYWLYAYATDRAGNVQTLRIAVTVQ